MRNCFKHPTLQEALRCSCTAPLSQGRAGIHAHSTLQAASRLAPPMPPLRDTKAFGDRQVPPFTLSAPACEHTSRNQTQMQRNDIHALHHTLSLHGSCSERTHAEQSPGARRPCKTLYGQRMLSTTRHDACNFHRRSPNKRCRCTHARSGRARPANSVLPLPEPVTPTLPSTPSGDLNMESLFTPLGTCARAVAVGPQFGLRGYKRHPSGDDRERMDGACADLLWVCTSVHPPAAPGGYTR